MDKVVLTKEQAEAIEKWENGTQLLKAAVVGLLNHGEDEPIAEMPIETLAKAIYIGYEVEPEFKVGDWVVHNEKRTARIIKIKENIIYIDKDGVNTVPMYYRHATSEEIKQEKERRWWKKHGREVWELKDGDVLISKKTNKVYEVSQGFSDIIQLNTSIYFIDVVKQNFKVVCFAEQRLDKEDTQ